jgi:pimeloyl-ACP methyl ester carboxylesterase
VNVLTYDDLREVILVGTSSNGAVVSGVAEQVPERISQLIYVDAFVPDGGQALWDLLPMPRRPTMQAPAAQQLPRTYIRCHSWPNPRFDHYAEIAGNDPRWRSFT